MATTSRGRTALLYLAALVPPLLLLWAVARNAVSVPFMDDWQFVPLIEQVRGGHVPWAALAAPHDEHRLLIPRILIIATTILSGGNYRAQCFLTVGVVAALSLALLFLLRRSLGPGRSSATAWLLANVVLFSPIQWHNWLWPMQFCYFLPFAFLALALAGWYSGLGRDARHGLALLCAWAATWSFVQGLLLWPVLLAVVLRDPRTAPRERRIAGAGWALSGLAAGLLYAHGLWHNSADPSYAYLHHGVPPTSSTLALLRADPLGTLGKMGQFALAMFGNALGRGALRARFPHGGAGRARPCVERPGPAAHAALRDLRHVLPAARRAARRPRLRERARGRRRGGAHPVAHAAAGRLRRAPRDGRRQLGLRAGPDGRVARHAAHCAHRRPLRAEAALAAARLRGRALEVPARADRGARPPGLLAPAARAEPAARPVPHRPHDPARARAHPARARRARPDPRRGLRALRREWPRAAGGARHEPGRRRRARDPLDLPGLRAAALAAPRLRARLRVRRARHDVGGEPVRPLPLQDPARRAAGRRARRAPVLGARLPGADRVPPPRGARPHAAGGRAVSPQVSVVIPFFDEEESAGPLVAELRPVLDGLGRSYEVLLVNDGSRDATGERLR